MKLHQERLLKRAPTLVMLILRVKCKLLAKTRVLRLHFSQNAQHANNQIACTL
jgi:hypothetical protein